MKKSTQLRIFIFSLLFIVLIVVAKTTQNMRSEADRELQKETSLSGARNNQIETERQALDDYEHRKRQAQRDRDFQRFLGKE